MMKKKPNYKSCKSNTETSKIDVATILDKKNSLGIVKTKKVSLKHSYTYNSFVTVMDKSPFTLAEWADLLYISERTLQRYAKSNATFNGLQIERIMELEKLIIAGNSLFHYEFRDWLMHNAIYFNSDTPYSLLTTHNGITQVYNRIGAIQYGTCA